METQLQAAEQQNQELLSQLHHKDMRVANAEAAQRSAESERDAVAQENAKLEEKFLRHQQVEISVTFVHGPITSNACCSSCKPFRCRDASDDAKSTGSFSIAMPCKVAKW